jgi:hypothetical protein
VPRGTREGGDGLPFSTDRFRDALDARGSHEGGNMPAIATDRRERLVDGYLRLGSPNPANIPPLACMAICGPLRSIFGLPRCRPSGGPNGRGSWARR